MLSFVLYISFFLSVRFFSSFWVASLKSNMYTHTFQAIFIGRLFAWFFVFFFVVYFKIFKHTRTHFSTISIITYAALLDAWFSYYHNQFVEAQRKTQNHRSKYNTLFLLQVNRRHMHSIRLQSENWIWRSVHSARFFRFFFFFFLIFLVLVCSFGAIVWSHLHSHRLSWCCVLNSCSVCRSVSHQHTLVIVVLTALQPNAG